MQVVLLPVTDPNYIKVSNKCSDSHLINEYIFKQNILTSNIMAKYVIFRNGQVQIMTWVSIVIVETKEHSPNRLKKFKQTLSAFLTASAV